MPIFKRVLCRERLRQVPSQFSWVDHRLVRDRHICRCSHPALALYLFLVTVCDGQGLSYYSEATLCRMLSLDSAALARARQELISARMIAYQCPLYQVLALDPAPPRGAGAVPVPQASARAPAPARPREAEAENFGQILRQIMDNSQ